MPRIARPATLETVRARKELSAYLARSGMSANALAKAAGVGQPTISRFLSGRTKAITPAVEPLLTYASIEMRNGIPRIENVLDNPRVRSALQRFLDENPGSAEVLALLIDALRPVVSRTLSASPRSSS